MLNSLFRFVGVALGLALVALIGGGLWWGYDRYYAKDRELAKKEAELAVQKAEVARLAADVKAKARQIERLETALRLLKVDQRIAYVDVLDQGRTPNGDRLQTKIEFVEVAKSGEPLGDPKTFTIDGDLLYVDYWVIKFDDQLVEQGDPLRSTSLALFQRLFGEFQEPSEGFTLDRPGTRPRVYGQDAMSEFEKELWDNFWEYATNAQRAKAAGVRAAHGEAPSIKLVPNRRYKIELRASGGLSVTPEDRPPRGPASARMNWVDTPG
jgi:hypothetical protein